MKSKEELYLYIENLKKIAQERSLEIGWERHNAFNPFYYKIFVKDSFGNSWIDNFSNSSTDLDGMFEVWQEIEKIMNKFIERTKE